MKIRKVCDMAVIPLFVFVTAVFSSSVLADQGDRIEDRLDNRGDRIEDRLDRKGDRIDRRLDRKSDRAADAGRDRLSKKLARLEAAGASGVLLVRGPNSVSRLDPN